MISDGNLEFENGYRAIKIGQKYNRECFEDDISDWSTREVDVHDILVTGNKDFDTDEARQVTLVRPVFLEDNTDTPVYCRKISAFKDLDGRDGKFHFF